VAECDHSADAAFIGAPSGCGSSYITIFHILIHNPYNLYDAFIRTLCHNICAEPTPFYVHKTRRLSTTSPFKSTIRHVSLQQVTNGPPYAELHSPSPCNRRQPSMRTSAQHTTACAKTTSNSIISNSFVSCSAFYPSSLAHAYPAHCPTGVTHSQSQPTPPNPEL
jgi:hypothetical protein